MTPDVLGALLLGLVCGLALGWWRAFVYCRKLLHFSVNLDDWAHYDEHTRQARPKTRPRAMPMYGADHE